MQQVLSFLKSLLSLCVFCGALFVMMDIVDSTFSPLILPIQTAHAAQPSKNAELVSPMTNFSPSQYENHAKDIEDLPPQF